MATATATATGAKTESALKFSPMIYRAISRWRGKTEALDQILDSIRVPRYLLASTNIHSGSKAQYNRLRRSNFVPGIILGIKGQHNRNICLRLGDLESFHDIDTFSGHRYHVVVDEEEIFVCDPTQVAISVITDKPEYVGFTVCPGTTEADLHLGYRADVELPARLLKARDFLMELLRESDSRVKVDQKMKEMVREI